MPFLCYHQQGAHKLISYLDWNLYVGVFFFLVFYVLNMSYFRLLGTKRKKNQHQIKEYDNKIKLPIVGAKKWSIVWEGFWAATLKCVQGATSRHQACCWSIFLPPCDYIFSLFQVAWLPSGHFSRLSSAMKTSSFGWPARSTKKSRAQPSLCQKQTRSIRSSLILKHQERCVCVCSSHSYIKSKKKQIISLFVFSM